MARYHGKVGYGISVETPVGSGVWKDQITEKTYFGDVIRKTSSLEVGEKVNGDITIGNSISILADQYATQHFSRIKYIGWSGALWNVTQVEVKSPRLILTLGSVYNGPTPTVASTP